MMNWYRDFKRIAMPLDPDAWKNDSNPNRFMSDQDKVWSPYGGMIPQKQDPDKLEERYKGVHFTFSPEIAAIYANSKANENDPPVIIELDSSGMQMELDADASQDYAMDTYIDKKKSEWGQLLEAFDAQEIDADEFESRVIDDLWGDVDNYTVEEDVHDVASDIVTQYTRNIPPSIVKEDLEMLNANQIVQKIRNTLDSDIPKEWYIHAVNQFRVFDVFDDDKVKAIYRVPWINFGDIYQGGLYDISDEDLEEKGWTKRDDGSVVDDQGRIILDYEDMDYDHWISREILYENPNSGQGESVWHGTSFSRAQKAFPQLFGVKMVATGDQWYKTAQDSISIEQIATRVRKSILRDDDESLKSLCLPVSRHLAQILINNGYREANVVQGTFTVDEPDSTVTEEWNIDDFVPAEYWTEEYRSADGSWSEEALEAGEEMMENATYTPLHYWVQLNNIVVDITADQFNDELETPVPEVMVGDINSLDRYTIIMEDFTSPRIMYDWAV
jgi:hypothetical protein